MDNDELVEKNIKLVHSIAYRYLRRFPRHTEVDDLIADGYLGLVKAAKSFDASRGLKFVTYAKFRIKGAIIDGIRKKNRDYGRADSKSPRRRMHIVSIEDEEILSDVSKLTIEQASQLENYAKWETIDAAKRAIHKLPARHRLILLRLLRETKRSDMAKEFKVNETRIYQLKQWLFKKLKQYA